MSQFDFNKLLVVYTPPATIFRPSYGRTYNVNFNDDSDNILVQISEKSINDKTSHQLENVITATWTIKSGEVILLVNCKTFTKMVETSNEFKSVKVNNLLETALQAIITADQPFFTHFPWLYDSKIMVTLKLSDNKIDLINIGTPRSFRIDFDKQKNEPSVN